jgi:transposase-like protein
LRQRAGSFNRRSIHDLLEKISIDKIGSKIVAVNGLIAHSWLHIKLHQSKCLNYILEQSHRVTKRQLRSLLWLQTFHILSRLIASIETMQMIAKGQMLSPSGKSESAAEQF